MLQRLPITLAQVKAGNTSENLLNEIKQIIYSLYRAKEITQKVYKNIRNTMNQHMIYMEKYKKVIQKNKCKISGPTWNEKFELPDGSYSVSDIQDYFEYIFKKQGEKTNTPSINKQ